MLKLLKFTSHGIRDLDIMRGVRVRCAELPNSRCAELPKSRCAVWLHCAAVRTTSIENVCVVNFVDSVSGPRTVSYVKREKLKEVERSGLFIKA